MYLIVYRKGHQVAENKGISGFLAQKLVPPAGLEPARLAAEDFESSASTIPPEGHAALLAEVSGAGNWA